MPTIAKMLVDEFVHYGVDVVFGLPGGEIVEVLDLIRDHGIDFVLVRNENAACFMAETVARLTGKPGVVLTTLGPGATNAYAGVANAYLDRAPILFLTAQTDPELLDRYTHQVLDLQACFAPVTKFTIELSPTNAAHSIRYAFQTMLSGRPGPVHLGICNRVARTNLEEIPPHSTITGKPQPILHDLHRAVERLQTAQRPIIVTGLGIIPDYRDQQVQLLAELLQAPVVDTPKSKGVLSAHHPLFAGTIGLTQHDPAYALLDESDCIVAIGLDAVELVKVWNQPQPLIWIANCENQNPRLPSEIELIAPIGDVLERLNELLQHAVQSLDWGVNRVQVFREKVEGFSSPVPLSSQRISPMEVIETVREHTPLDVIITTDVGSHKIFTALNWKALQPNRYFVSNGLSTMGFGLASAISAARETGATTVCIVGDGGLSMGMGELGLAVELALPLIVVVMNDNALDLIRNAQIQRNKPTFGTEFSNPNYEALASAFGYGYFRVENKAACVHAIQQAVAQRQPVLIDALIDPNGYTFKYLRQFQG